MGLGPLIGRILEFYVILIIIYVLMSWFAGSLRGGLAYDAYRVLGSICEPYLSIFRRILPTAMVGGGGIDFSPMVAIIVLQLIADFIGRAL